MLRTHFIIAIVAIGFVIGAGLKVVDTFKPTVILELAPGIYHTIGWSN